MARLHLTRMTLADFPELKRLSARSRLKMAEELWDSAISDTLPVPSSHKALVRTRRAAYAQGKMKTVTLAALKQSIQRRP